MAQIEPAMEKALAPFSSAPLLGAEGPVVSAGLLGWLAAGVEVFAEG